MGRRGWQGLLLVSLAILGRSDVSGATILRETDLEQLVAESESALVAEVVEVRYGLDERRLHSTWVTVRVEDPIFGERLPVEGGSFTFKSYGSPRRMPDGSRVFIDGTPEYRVGDTLLLMLLPVSRWGFSGTAGLHRGVFRVAGDPSARTAKSLGGNARVLGDGGLSRWLDAGSLPEADVTRGAGDGPVPLTLLRRALVDLATAAGKATR